MRMIVEKGLRRLTLYAGDREPIVFPIALGARPSGHKEREGDGRTPEGDYSVCTRNENSKYHLSLGLSYPNSLDAEAALSRGEITPEDARAIHLAHRERRRPPWDTPLGGFIMIHGGGVSGDWTQGCIALKNEDMEILFRLCPMGTPVYILP